MTANSNASKIRFGEVFMPCLLGRLIDQNPEQKTEVFTRGISLKQLKQNILWNIELILNSRSHPTSDVWADDPAVTDSVLGMGVSDFCGLSHSATAREKLRQEIIHQLSVFEPRLEKDSLEVNYIHSNDEKNSDSVLELEIFAWISVETVREELVFRSRLDLESGTATLNNADER